jgi:uncharacterized membrane protein YraQ (UPF0718 family)
VVTLYIVSGIALIISFATSFSKTLRALRIATRKFANILPNFLLMILLVSISLFFVPEHSIAQYLGGKNLYVSALFASVLGSLAVMPGFVAFPLGGILLEKGVSYTVIAAFTTTLMLVGVVSYPFERKFLGTRIALARNVISYIVSLLIAVAIGLFYNEILQ